MFQIDFSYTAGPPEKLPLYFEGNTIIHLIWGLVPRDGRLELLLDADRFPLHFPDDNMDLFDQCSNWIGQWRNEIDKPAQPYQSLFSQLNGAASFHSLTFPGQSSPIPVFGWAIQADEVEIKIKWADYEHQEVKDVREGKWECRTPARDFFQAIAGYMKANLALLADAIPASVALTSYTEVASNLVWLESWIADQGWTSLNTAN